MNKFDSELSATSKTKRTVHINEDPKNENISGKIPSRFLQHRKSSIPFVDREPIVRFIRHVEPHGENEHGGHSPEEVALEPLKPILKKSDFPILVDLRLLDYSTSVFNNIESIENGNLTTNDELERCSNYVEQIIQIFSKGERQARGSVDILTFPVASGCIEALSRYEGSMIIAILAVEKLSQIPLNTDSLLMTDILKLSEELLKDIILAQTNAVNLKKKALVRYQQWWDLLNRKGDFRIEHSKTKSPLYSKKIMPENVTMYEDILEDNRRYRFDGSTRIYRNSNDIILLTDVQDDVFMKYPEEIDETQLIVIAETVIEHAKELILYCQKQIDMALETIRDPILDKGFDCVKDKLIHLEFDTYFDPLCALELKNSLGDVVSRKGELLNITEHIVNYLKIMEKITKIFLKFCKQVSNKQKIKCCSIKPLGKEKVLSYLTALGNKDFMISLPLTDRFEKCIFHLEPTSMESRCPMIKENTEGDS